MFKANKFPGLPITPYDLSTQLRKHRYVYWKPCSKINPVNLAGALPALATAGAAQTDTFFLPGQIPVEVYQRTAQAALAGAFTTGSGLQIQGDVDADNEGLEYCWGGLYNENPFAHTVGTTLGSFYRIKVKVEDITGLDNTCFGWRKVQAFDASAAFVTAVDPVYTDVAGIGLMSATGGQVVTLTDLNNSGTPVVTDTAFDIVDGSIVEFGVNIFGARATYYINGVQVAGGAVVSKDGAGTAITAQTLGQVPDFDFDSTDILVPVASIQQDTDQSIVYLQELEIGRWVSKSKSGRALA